jgi:hypothetical protein
MLFVLGSRYSGCFLDRLLIICKSVISYSVMFLIGCCSWVFLAGFGLLFFGFLLAIDVYVYNMYGIKGIMIVL